MKKLTKFISVHIPKTGGTVFQRRVIRETFGEKKVQIDYQRRPLSKQPYNHKMAKKEIIHGHFKASKYLMLKMPYVTWLRDPLSRIVSVYNYSVIMRGNTQDTFDEFIEKNRNDISNYIDIPRKHFAFIGIVECWEESIELFGELIKKDLSKYTDPIFIKSVKDHYKKLNKKYVRPTPEQRQKFIDLNQEDIQLYNEERSRYA